MMSGSPIRPVLATRSSRLGAYLFIKYLYEQKWLLTKKTLLVQGITLKLPSGSKVALVGPSGGGKVRPSVIKVPYHAYAVPHLQFLFIKKKEL